MASEKVAPEEQVAPPRKPMVLYGALAFTSLAALGLLVGVIVLATSTVASTAAAVSAAVDSTHSSHSSHSDSTDSVSDPAPVSATNEFMFSATKPPMQMANPCSGTKPTSGFDNKDCFIGETINAVEQAGGNITKGYEGQFNTSAVPIVGQYFETGLCPVNVHWHLGTEHLSVGQYDETGTGPTEIAHRRRAAGKVREGFQCKLYNSAEPTHTKKYDWKHCDSHMEIGQTYEVHWPHSKGGACGTIHQYQTPFYDGVFCNGDKLVPTTQDAIGVQAQVFVIVNDEKYYYPDLIRGMIIDDTHGIDVGIYTGSTTGTSRSNSICSAYAPITWQVDRTCHPISASSFDKMCADMKAQHDDMSDDLHAHGSRELVDGSLIANNLQDRPM